MDQVTEVKSKVDLVEIIASHLPLKKTGRNFAALCPFHQEKTPSLMISPDRQVWKCFGCGVGGDVFTFLEKIEGWEFRETLEELAKRVGVKLTSYKPSGVSQLKEKLLKINQLAAKFYHHLLIEHPIGERARKYLIGRGIKRQLWEKFGLGFAPASWENLLTFLTKRGFSLADIATAGLVIARSPTFQKWTQSAKTPEETRSEFAAKQGFYDRFRNRLIFPLKDARGGILGFSGRILELVSGDGQSPMRGEPKYINTPETPIFNKGSLLFGLDVARETIRKKNEVLLVEGEFDVLSAQSVGVANVVASKGTALTEKQVATLARLCENVLLCFDTDLAGDAAARRGIELLDYSQVNVKVVELAEYKDPDELAQKDAVGFKKAITQAVNVYDYFLDSARKRHNLATAFGKKKIGQEILPIIGKISDELVKAHYIEKLASILNLDVSFVVAALEKVTGSSQAWSLPVFPEELPPTAPSTQSQISQEEYFLALILTQDEVTQEIIEKIEPADFLNEKAHFFWQWLRGIIKSSKIRSLKKLLKQLPADLNQFVDHLYLVNVSPDFSEKELWLKELHKVFERIKKERLRRQLADISQRLKLAQEKQDAAQITVLTKRFDKIAKYLK